MMCAGGNLRQTDFEPLLHSAVECNGGQFQSYWPKRSAKFSSSFFCGPAFLQEFAYIREFFARASRFWHSQHLLTVKNTKDIWSARENLAISIGIAENGKICCRLFSTAAAMVSGMSGLRFVHCMTGLLHGGSFPHKIWGRDISAFQKTPEKKPRLQKGGGAELAGKRRRRDAASASRKVI